MVAAGSLTAAARSRGISPAMVSKRIARLEARLGARLLNRTTRRLEMTARGEAFHYTMLGVLATIRDAEARVADRAGAPAGPLRVCAPTSFGRLHVAPHLKPFLDAHPLVALELNLSDGFDDLIGGGIDLAIRIAPSIGAGLVAHRLADSRRVLCAAPAYLAEHGVPDKPDDLSRHRLLAAAGQLPWRLAGPDGALTVAGESHVRTNSSEVVRELAIGGVGIALRSLWEVAGDLATGRLVRVLATIGGAADVGIHAVHPRGTPSPSAAALMAHLSGAWAGGFAPRATGPVPPVQPRSKR